MFLATTISTTTQKKQHLCQQGIKSDKNKICPHSFIHTQEGHISSSVHLVEIALVVKKEIKKVKMEPIVYRFSKQFYFPA